MVNNLETVTLETKIKVTLTEKIKNQIQYLCKNISREEWSGILFYSLQGSIKDAKNATITLEEILPMDKGSQAYTEYELDNRFIDHLMKHPNLMGMKIGHIHSHNIMNAFFSGTDMSELKDNSAGHNFYLSVIVNNFGEIVGKIAMRAKIKTSIVGDYKAIDENGNEFNISPIDTTIDMEKLFIYDCDIRDNFPTVGIDEDFSSHVEAIIKKEEFSRKNPRHSFLGSEKLFGSSINVQNKEKDLKDLAYFINKDSKSLAYQDEEDLEFFNEMAMGCLIYALCKDYVKEDMIDKLSLEQSIQVFMKAGTENYQTKVGNFLESLPEIITDYVGEIDAEEYVQIVSIIIDNLEEYLQFNLISMLQSSLKNSLKQFIEHG